MRNRARWSEARSTREASDRVTGRVLEAKADDEQGGRVFRVRVIAAGMSRNGRNYPQPVLEAAVPLYDGVKAFDHHRTDGELESSTISGLIGSYRNVAAVKDGIEADLHLLPSATHAAEAFDASLAAEAAGLPPLIGISHDVLANYEPKTAKGKRFDEATQIVRVLSADAVADPAAGGRAVRMVAGGIPTNEGETMDLKELLAKLRAATAEERAQLLAEHKQVLADYDLSDSDIDRLLAKPAGDETKPAAPAADPAKAEAPAAPATEKPADELVGVGAVERSSMMGGMLIREAVNRHFPEGARESASTALGKVLPDRFDEKLLAERVELVKASREGIELSQLTPTPVKVTRDEHDAKIARLDLMFGCRQTKEGVELVDGWAQADGYKSIKQAFIDLTGTRLDPIEQDLSAMVIRESYRGAAVEGAPQRRSESMTTASWGEILGDSITRRMTAEYRRPNLQSWRPLVSDILPINDFRTNRRTRFGGYGTLPAVAQGGTYQPLTSPPDEEATYAISKRGGTEDLTMEMVANDDLGAIRRIPVRLGNAAAQTLFRAVFDTFATNPTIYDAVTLFHATHGNTGAGVLSDATLNTGRVAMMKQTAYGDAVDVLGLTPAFIVVPPELFQTAKELTTATTKQGATNDGTPNVNNGIAQITVPYFTDTNDWFLVADPSAVPTFEVGFYQGRQDPELFVQDQPTVGPVFTADKITWKIRHIWGLTVLDYRGFWRALNCPAAWRTPGSPANPGARHTHHAPTDSNESETPHEGPGSARRARAAGRCRRAGHRRHPRRVHPRPGPVPGGRDRRVFRADRRGDRRRHQQLRGHGPQPRH
jgi:hypothetical protein